MRSQARARSDPQPCEQAGFAIQCGVSFGGWAYGWCREGGDEGASRRQEAMVDFPMLVLLLDVSRGVP